MGCLPDRDFPGLADLEPSTSPRSTIRGPAIPFLEEGDADALLHFVVVAVEAAINGYRDGAG